MQKKISKIRVWHTGTFMLNMVTLALIVAEIGRTLRQTGITQSVLLVIQIRNVNFVRRVTFITTISSIWSPQKDVQTAC